ncbi:MAG: hypothetical protein ABIJ92_01425, partial [Candidatus Aenigmatarchaeota archaeon]
LFQMPIQEQCNIKILLKMRSNLRRETILEPRKQWKRLPAIPYRIVSEVEVRQKDITVLCENPQYKTYTF